MTRQRNIKGLLILGAAFVLVLGAAAFLVAAPASAQGTPSTPCPYGNMPNGGMMGGRGGMMGRSNPSWSQPCPQTGRMMGGYGMMSGNGMMSGGMMSGGMMGNMMNMMGGGMMNANSSFGPGRGMMGQWTPPASLAPAAGTPLTLEKATAVAKAYVTAWNSQTKLELGEVMQFKNHFYGEAIETDSKRGAFEFLIDPASGIVYAEPGPNMMWNLRYGTMGNHMGISSPTNDGDKMTITPDQAVKAAQDYLDKAQAGSKVESTPLAFYGFYTLDILRDGKVTGMLSVNGYTGQVWLHQWHGDFVAQTSQQ